MNSGSSAASISGPARLSCSLSSSCSAAPVARKSDRTSPRLKSLLKSSFLLQGEQLWAFFLGRWQISDLNGAQNGSKSLS